MSLIIFKFSGDHSKMRLRTIIEHSSLLAKCRMREAMSIILSGAESTSRVGTRNRGTSTKRTGAASAGRVGTESSSQSSAVRPEPGHSGVTERSHRMAPVISQRPNGWLSSAAPSESPSDGVAAFATAAFSPIGGIS
jgi:hypothetical protein